jgi:hypothetical protein
MESKKNETSNIWRDLMDAIRKLFAAIMGGIKKVRDRLSGEGYAHKLERLKEAAYDQQANFKDHEKQFDNVLDASKMKIDNLKQAMSSRVASDDASLKNNQTEPTLTVGEAAVINDEKYITSEEGSVRGNINVIGNAELDEGAKKTPSNVSEVEKKQKIELGGTDSQSSQNARTDNKDIGNKEMLRQLKASAGSVPQGLGRVPGIERAGKSHIPAFVGDTGYWARNGNEAWNQISKVINEDAKDDFLTTIASGDTDDIASLIYEMECSLAGDDLKDAANSLKHDKQFNIILLALWNDACNAAGDINNKESEIGKAYLRWSLSKPSFDDNNVFVKHLYNRIDNVKSQLDNPTFTDKSLIKASNIWIKTTKEKFDKNIQSGHYPSNTTDIKDQDRTFDNEDILEQQTFIETDGHQDNLTDMNLDDVTRPAAANMKGGENGHREAKMRSFKDDDNLDLPHVDRDTPSQ